MPNDVPTIPTACSIELFPQSIPGGVTISYYVSESKPTGDQPYPDPTNIISWDQEVYVIADITLADQVRRFLCGYLCVDVDVDTCGPAPDLAFDEVSVELDPCGDGHYTPFLTLPAGTFAPKDGTPARCGRVYRVCVTVGSYDKCTPAGPGLIWGACGGFELTVHPPVPAEVPAAAG